MKSFSMSKAAPVIDAACAKIGEVILATNPDANLKALNEGMREIVARLVRDEEVIVTGSLDEIEETPDYNLTADALVMARVMWLVGDRKGALNLVASAFSEHDADEFFTSIAEVNALATENSEETTEEKPTETSENVEADAGEEEVEIDAALSAQIDDVLADLEEDMNSADETDTPPNTENDENASDTVQSSDEDDGEEVEELPVDDDENEPEEVVSTAVDRKAIAMANKISMSGNKSAIARGMQVVSRYRKAS